MLRAMVVAFPFYHQRWLSKAQIWETWCCRCYLMLPVLKKKRLDHPHFSDFLLNDKVFKEFAMLSMGGDSEDWFRKLSEGMKEDEEKKFDEACQSFMEDIWGCLRTRPLRRRIRCKHHISAKSMLTCKDQTMIAILDE
jgi:hypothetical protein